MRAIGRFYATDVKVTYTYLTSDKFKSTSVKTGRGKVDDNTKKPECFCKKQKYTILTLPSHLLEELGINESQFTASRFYTRRT